MRKMEWIVIGEKGGKIHLVSKSTVAGMLPKGSYLTVDEGETKFILRIDDSKQAQLYTPDPLIAEMGLEPLEADRKCQNSIIAYRARTLLREKMVLSITSSPSPSPERPLRQRST